MKELHRDGFNNGFYPFEGNHHLTVPADWTPDWSTDPREGYLDQPEYKPRITDGNTYLGIHTTSATHDAVIWRHFAVLGGRLIIQAGVMIDSHPEAGHGVRIGIDIAGGTDFSADTVQWSQWYSQDVDIWENRKWFDWGLETSCPAGFVTVFLHTRNRERNHAAAHFDDVVLLGEGDEPPPGDSVTEARVIELATQVAEAVYSMRETQTMHRLAEVIGEGWPV